MVTKGCLPHSWTQLASPAGVLRGARISSLPTKGGREEIRAPLKTPAGEARTQWPLFTLL